MPAQFTQAQLETLRAFADHVKAGRSFIVFAFRLSAFLGAIASAVLAYYAYVPKK